MDRRQFFAAAGAASAVAFHTSALDRVNGAARDAAGEAPHALAANEDFWAQIRHAFTLDRAMVNLNNGGVCPSPRVVAEAMDRYLTISNMAPSYYMWRVLDPQVESVRKLLAADFGCDPEEIAITRNASEALETVQLGIPLERGDEVLTTNQDYPRMITTWQQRERRDGIVLRQVPFAVPAKSPAELVRLFESHITPRTRVIHFCHITNRTGQIFPVRQIVQMARKRGIECIVDGAHAYAQFPMKRDELDCDYYGTSLHKWLLAPIGTGFLYVRQSKISKIWPLMAAPEKLDGDIRKFESIGTHPAANRLAIAEAMTFHQTIGGERKAARLRHLRRIWTERLSEIPGVRSLTPDDPSGGCGIGLLSADGVDPGKLVQRLWADERIYVIAIRTPNEYEGIRITPNVYTTIGEVNRFCAAVERLVPAVRA